MDRETEDILHLLRADEVARILGLGRTKVYAMLASGELPVVRVGRCLRVPADGLAKWVRERTHNVCPTPEP